MNRPDEIAALADRLEKLSKVGFGYDINDTDRSVLRKSAAELRLSATSPGDAARDGWTSLSEDTSWLDGRDVVLLVRGMEVSARYCRGEWSEDTPINPREYCGPVWSCFDDQFQLEIEECHDDPRRWSHDGATHWRVPHVLTEIDKSQRFYGAQCSSYPDCKGGCGLGCSHEMCATTRAPAEKAGDEFTRSFDTRGTTMRRRCNIIEITCETGEIANRVADQLRSPSATPTPPSGDVIAQIAAERQRQIAKGYDASHDDEHTDGAIAMAVAAYAKEAARKSGFSRFSPRPLYPWSYDTFRDYSPREGLIVAASLCVAEIERIDRSLIQSAAHGGGTQVPEANAVDLAATSKRSEGGASSPPTGHTGPSDPAQEPEAVAYRYRWKIDGEWTSWHFSDASQKHPSLNSLQEQPVYTRPVSLDRETLALEAALNKIPSDLYWLIGKGKTRPDEPLYACQILNPATGAELACAENDDLITAITDAIIALIEGRT